MEPKTPTIVDPHYGYDTRSEGPRDPQRGQSCGHRTAPATDTASISGFTTQRAADNYAADIECDQRRNTWLAPKTPSSARTTTLPPFLITMLRKHLEQHDNEFVFTTEDGTWLWRSTKRGSSPAELPKSPKHDASDTTCRQGATTSATFCPPPQTVLMEFGVPALAQSDQVSLAGPDDWTVEPSGPGSEPAEPDLLGPILLFDHDEVS